MNYLDYNNKIIKDAAKKIISGKDSLEDKVEAIFNYVKNDISFGFLPGADLVTAPDIIKAGKGQCNNKSILFHSLCKAAGIKTRLHFSSITKKIHRGIFKGLLYFFAPKEVSHSWIEVDYKEQWVPIDSFINDEEFYQGGKQMLNRKGIKTGFSVSCANENSSSEFSLKGDQFVQMDAVVEDHGVYDDPEEYFNSENYLNNPSPFKMFVYRLHVRGMNNRIGIIRKGLF